MTEKIILGIDPGTNVMGYALLKVVERKPSLIVMGVLTLSKIESHYLRLRRIHERTLQLINEYHPDELAIESPFYGKNAQVVLKLGLLPDGTDDPETQKQGSGVNAENDLALFHASRCGQSRCTGAGRRESRCTRPSGCPRAGRPRLSGEPGSCR